MNGKDLFRAIGETDDAFIDSLEASPAKRSRALRWLSLAACLCLAVGAALHLTGREHYPIREVYIDPNALESSEVAIVPHWEELEIWQQFGSMDNAWNCGGAQVPAGQLGEDLGTRTLTGRDEYTEQEHSIQAQVRAIQGLSPDCALAVQYDGTDTWYSFYNWRYRPETLGQFIDDLDLREQLHFGKVYYEYRKPNGDWASVEFEGLPADAVWEMLLSAREAENIHTDTSFSRRVMDISVDLALLGFRNISLAVTEDGCLVTNILATGKTFHIGKDKTEAFVKYVKENLQGYETVLVYEAPVSESDEPGAQSQK